LASELGKHEKAYEYAKFSSRLDIDDYNRNTREGLHIPATAGAWLTFVYGFGGLRADGEKLAFNPSIPNNWTSFSFNLRYMDARINILISREAISFKVYGDSTIPVTVFGKEYMLDGQELKVDMPVERLG
jgi:maltose phosphorylase